MGGLPTPFAFLVFIGLLWNQPVDAKRCPVKEKVKGDEVPDVCSKFNVYVFQGYELDLDRVVEANGYPPDMTQDDWQEKSKSWMFDSTNTDQCFFFKYEEQVIDKCCGGYTGDDCETAICDPPCANGECIAPDMCQCEPGFTGLGCVEEEILVTNDRKYCYQGDTCNGARLLDGADSPMTMSECCQNGGGAWGLFGTSDCLTCISTDDSEDKKLNEIARGIDTPGVIPNEGNLPFRTCFSYGPNYYRTFDGLEFQFPGRCSYTLFSDGTRTVTVSMINCQKVTTCQKKLTIKLNSKIQVVVLGDHIEYNDEDISQQLTISKGWTPMDTTGLIIEFRGHSYYLEYGQFRIRWDVESSWLITVEEGLNAEDSFDFKGICGNFDGNPQNDMRMPNGQMTGHPSVFGNSWVMSSDMDKCPDAPEPKYSCKDSASQDEAMKACSNLRAEPFTDCHDEVLVRGYVFRCVNDYCAVLNEYNDHPGKDSPSVIADFEAQLQAVRCMSFGAYCHECATKGIVVEWRTGELCPKDCPGSLQYSECVPKCPRTCANINSILPADCLNQFYPGCQCPEGTFLHQDECIPANQCPCWYQRQWLSSGSTIKTGCNHCVCNGGRWDCTAMPCAKTCSVIGHQHFSTFDNRMYDFNGGDGCKYVLVNVRDEEVGDKGAVTVTYQVTKCTNIGAMCIKSIWIYYLADDGKETSIHIRNDFTATINSEDYDDLSIVPFHNEYVYVKKVTSLFVIVRGFGFKCLYAKTGRIYCIFDPYYANKLEGLCGNNDGDKSNDFFTKDGMDGVSCVKFANSWKVDGSCNNDGVGCGLNPCEIMSSNADSAETECQFVGKASIFGECNKVMQNQKFRENCQKDMCARSDTTDFTPLCVWVAALARACKEVGVIVDWQSDIPLRSRCENVMGYKCSAPQMFHECSSVCGACRDRQLDSIYCEAECEAGCRCPEGQLLDDNGNCVPVAQCTCYDSFDMDNPIKPPGGISHRGCVDCECKNAIWDCGDVNCTHTVKCPNNQIYRDDLVKCNHTCSTYNKRCPSDSPISQGCGCADGLVLNHEGECVMPPMCPCYYDGEFYEKGDEVQVGCKTFVCENQRWVVISEEGCSDSCVISNEAQYITFDGLHYTFMGSCEYYLTRETVDQQFVVTGQNVPCGVIGLTCFKSITVELYKTMTFRFRNRKRQDSGFGFDIDLEFDNRTIALDNNGNARVTNGIFFTHSGLFYILYFEKTGLIIQHDGGTRVYIKLPRKQWKNKVDGLCGNFNGNTDDEFGLFEKPQEFGASQKIDMSCPDTPVDDDFSPCEEHPERRPWAQELCKLITTGSIFEECRQQLTDVSEYYESCLFDACNCYRGGDCECLCTALANFVEACHRVDVIVYWRNQRLCPIMCPPGQEYQSCGPACRQSCQNIGDEPEPQCDKLACVEGCFCPEGEYLDNGKCVSIEECPCVHEGVEYTPGTILGLDCQTCTCVNSSFQCVGEKCPNITCDEDHFACKGHYQFKCIHKDFICDGMMDCPDGSDEFNCTFECADGEFKCYQGKDCIPDGYVCDGHPDCLDNSDEHFCPPPDCSDERFFSCDNGRCIPLDYTCDGKVDCGIRDFSDEANCNVTDCPLETHFKCRETGLCLPKYVICDDHDDCGDGSDEEGCQRCADFVINSDNSEEYVVSNPKSFNPSIFDGTNMVENVNSASPICFTILGQDVRLISLYFWARNFDEVVITPNENGVPLASEQQTLTSPIPGNWFFYKADFGTTPSGIFANGVCIQFVQNSVSGAVQAKGLVIIVCGEQPTTTKFTTTPGEPTTATLR